MSRFTVAVLVVTSCVITPGWARGPSSEFAALVSMQKDATGTFYVTASLDGHAKTFDLLVDTGSSFMVLNETLLEDLKAHGTAEYVDNIDGVMADGSHRVIPIYRLTTLRIGDACLVHDVEAAIFPGDTRPILGMSVLGRLAPVTLSAEPPTLGLNKCQKASSAGSPLSLSVPAPGENPGRASQAMLATQPR